MTEQNEDFIFRTSIGDVVKAWRIKRGLRVIDLATLSGKSKGYISEIEHNKIRNPGDVHLISIAQALDIPVEYLVTRHLPDETDKQGKSEGKQLTQTPQPAATTREREGTFTFGSPLPSPRRRSLEEEELQEILTQLDELRQRVKKLIAQKGRRD